MNRNRVKRIQKLLSIEEIGIANILGGKSAEVDERLKGGLPIISCECGAEILVVPDLKAMNRAIKAHAVDHRKNEKTNRNKAITSGKIDQLLGQLTLIKMSQQNNT